MRWLVALPSAALAAAVGWLSIHSGALQPLVFIVPGLAAAGLFSGLMLGRRRDHGGVTVVVGLVAIAFHAGTWPGYPAHHVLNDLLALLVAGICTAVPAGVGSALGRLMRPPRAVAAAFRYRSG